MTDENPTPAPVPEAASSAPDASAVPDASSASAAVSPPTPHDDSSFAPPAPADAVPGDPPPADAVPVYPPPAGSVPGDPAPRRGAGRRGGWAPLHRMTLRGRLVLAVVALVAVLGIAISLVSALFLRGYLVEQLDLQLDQATSRVRSAAASELGTGQISADLLFRVVGGVRGVSGGTVVGFIPSGDVAGTSGYLSPDDPFADAVKLSAADDAKIAALRTTTAPVSVSLGTKGTFRMETVSLGPYGVIVVGFPLAYVQATTARLITIFLLVTVFGIMTAGAVGTLIVRLALRPLDRVAATATEVSQLPLDRGEVALAVRVPEEDTDPRTEVGRLGTAFNQMLGHVGSALAARQASENKVRQFVADASHELRTPLASIRGYAELTRRAPEPLPDSAVRSLARIESEADRMTDLVEDLLLLARLDEGRELDHDPVDLSRLVIDVVSDAHAAGGDHTWNVGLPPEPVTVIGDEKRLHQVLANLLTNARVHTPEGTIVDTAVRVEGERAVVTVTDDGPGIPEDLQPVLFERFARGDPSRARHTGSTGLGLAIVRAVVRAQGGEVAVDSGPGRTAFIVTLPVGQGAASDDEESVIDLTPEEIAALETDQQ